MKIINLEPIIVQRILSYSNGGANCLSHLSHSLEQICILLELSWGNVGKEKLRFIPSSTRALLISRPELMQMHDDSQNHNKRRRQREASLKSLTTGHFLSLLPTSVLLFSSRNQLAPQ